ncbi:MAG: hypothetical protein ACHQYP_11260, partial [Nitrospiria bacterium]
WKVRVGELMERIGLIETIQRLKSIFWASGHLAEPYVSTLNNTPHLQRFTPGAIKEILNQHHFKVNEFTGSVIFAGPFSNLFFTGFSAITNLNCIMGNWLSRIASGYYVACQKL